MEDQKKYLTCPHLTKKNVMNAVQLLKNKDNNLGKEDYICLECSFSNKNLTQCMKDHFDQSRHYCSLRSFPPYELYCFFCRDYQYCSLFDNLIGSKRKFSLVIEESTYERPSEKNSNKFIAKGLVNMGSTCFMNSILQVLCRITKLTQHPSFINHESTCNITNSSVPNSLIENISSKKETSLSSCLPCEFKKLAEKLNQSPTSEEDSFIIPSNFLFAFWSFVDYMASYSQQDAHEFFISLLNNLDILVETETPEQNPLSDIFKGIIQSTLRCTKCQNISIKQEIFLDLSLSLDIQSTLNSSEEEASDNNEVFDLYDLEDYLNFFTSPENIIEEMYCSECKGPQKKIKHLNIQQTPQILVLHFKRFDFLNQRKISKKISFPLENLDISKYCLPCQDDINEAEYDLIGLINHQGTLNAGHYISYVLDKESKSWLKCDDDKITQISIPEVEDSESYILFYEKKPYKLNK